MFTGVAFLISLKISLDFSLVHDLRVMRSSSTLKILSLSLCPPLKKKNMCISNKFPDDADAAGPGSTLKRIDTERKICMKLTSPTE